MEERISVKLSADHIFECDTNILGREGEGNTAQLEITVPEKLCSCSMYLDFMKPNGEKLRTPKLEIKDGVAVYKVVPYLLTHEGEVKVQAVLKTASGGTWKTTVKKYFNHDSINAEDYINENLQKTDFITEAQKVLDEFSGEVAQIATTLLNNTSFVDNIINRVEEITIEEVDVLQNDVTTLKGDVKTLQGDVEKLNDDYDELGKLFEGHTHNGLLCSVAFTNGTARLPEASARELINKMCFTVFEEMTDLSKRLHSGVFYIKNDVNTDNTPQPTHTYTTDYGTCGSFKLAYYPNTTYTDDNLKLWDKDGNLANVNGTLYIHKMGVML